MAVPAQKRLLAGNNKPGVKWSGTGGAGPEHAMLCDEGSGPESTTSNTGRVSPILPRLEAEDSGSEYIKLRGSGSEPGYTKSNTVIVNSNLDKPKGEEVGSMREGLWRGVEGSSCRGSKAGIGELRQEMPTARDVNLGWAGLRGNREAPKWRGSSMNRHGPRRRCNRANGADPDCTQSKAGVPEPYHVNPNAKDVRPRRAERRGGRSKPKRRKSNASTSGNSRKELFSDNRNPGCRRSEAVSVAPGQDMPAEGGNMTKWTELRSGGDGSAAMLFETGNTVPIHEAPHDDRNVPILPQVRRGNDEPEVRKSGTRVGGPHQAMPDTADGNSMCTELCVGSGRSGLEESRADGGVPNLARLMANTMEPGHITVLANENTLKIRGSVTDATDLECEIPKGGVIVPN